MRCRAIALVCLGFLLLLSGVTVAQDSQPTEYQLKAAFLFNFAKFVEWPTNAFSQKDAPFVIGIIGDNPFGKALDDTVRNKTVNEHPLQVKQFKSASEVTNQNCHILFISTSEKKRVKELIDGLGNAPLLTISETDQFTQSGGIINFVPEGNKIRFEINDEAAKRVGLKISSKLLSLRVQPKQ